MGMAADASASIDALQQAAAHTGNFHLQRFPAVDVFRLRGGRWNRRTLAWHTKESTCRELRQVLLLWTVSVVVPMADTQYASFSFSVNHIRPVLRAGTTHNLGVAAYMSDHIAVMKEGIVEDEGSRDYILKNSRDEYTRKLLDAVPSLGGVRYV